MEDKRHVDDAGDRRLTFADARSLARFLPPATPLRRGGREGEGRWCYDLGVRDGYDFTESKERERERERERAAPVEEIPGSTFPDIEWRPVDRAGFICRGSLRSRGSTRARAAGNEDVRREAELAARRFVRSMEINSLRPRERDLADNVAREFPVPWNDPRDQISLRKRGTMPPRSNYPTATR